MYDSYKREIYYLRISVTDKCNLRCTYCMPAEGVPPLEHADLLSFEEITAVVEEAVKLGFRKIRLTGGEPLVRKGIVDLVRMIKAVEGVEYLGMTTNGILLDRFAADLKAAGLDGINISLDTLDPERYREITRVGSIEEALRGVDAAAAAGFAKRKINMVIPDEPDDIGLEKMRVFCEEKGFQLQRIRQYSLMRTKGEEPVYERPPRCGNCNRLRLTCDGYLKPCLHSNTEIKVDFSDVAASIEKAVAGKPMRGHECTGRGMVSIGG